MRFQVRLDVLSSFQFTCSGWHGLLTQVVVFLLAQLILHDSDAARQADALLPIPSPSATLAAGFSSITLYALIVVVGCIVTRSWQVRASLLHLVVST